MNFHGYTKIHVAFKSVICFEDCINVLYKPDVKNKIVTFDRYILVSKALVFSVISDNRKIKSN